MQEVTGYKDPVAGVRSCCPVGLWKTDTYFLGVLLLFYLATCFHVVKQEIAFRVTSRYSEQNDRTGKQFLVKSAQPIQVKKFDCLLLLTFRNCTHLIIKADLWVGKKLEQKSANLKLRQKKNNYQVLKNKQSYGTIVIRLLNYKITQNMTNVWIQLVIACCSGVNYFSIS